MARIKLELPETFIYTAEIKVRVTDLNYGGHVGNDTIVGMLQDARVQFLTNLGYKDELSVEGLGLIQTDLAVVYKAEVFLGETIKVHLNAVDFNKYGCDIVYQLVSKSSNKEIARAKTGIVFFNYEERKIAQVPEGFLSKIESST